MLLDVLGVMLHLFNLVHLFVGFFHCLLAQLCRFCSCAIIYASVKDIRLHVYHKGFESTYKQWIWHGETENVGSTFSGRVDDKNDNIDGFQAEGNNEFEDNSGMAHDFENVIDDEERNIINPENIKEFLRWDMIDNSIVEIFMRHLYGYMRTHDIQNVGLVCPDDLQHMVKNGNRKPVERMLLDHKEKSWVLLPFFCERTHHYTLIVIRYYENKVHYFNSALGTGTSKNLTLKSYINEAWRILRVQGMGFLKLKPTWTDVGIVPQQSGGTECGYYVMRFMWLIISLCARESVPIETVFNSFDPYTIEQLEELREMWANTFLDELVN
ncbi:unnamed protein product [Cuscuta campestris]|uniref:Ubiquitin-like protease family profile domain-containing protein n=1 Tax=Cuscuta campestris TaxID=132261 RepID=A0A484L264_9ASTE|nr:unnamed protein product [Cuscuta campestris]